LNSISIALALDPPSSLFNDVALLLDVAPFLAGLRFDLVVIVARHQQ
jgi:hypothetical protein